MELSTTTTLNTDEKKPFKCEICDAYFEKKDNFNQPITSAHEGIKKSNLDQHIVPDHEGKNNSIVTFVMLSL